MSYFQQESSRLRFRKVSQEDIRSWEEFFVDNDHLPFLGLDLNKSKETLAKDWINKQLERYQEVGLGHLALELKSSGELIGMAGIIPRIIEDQKEYEIAYSLKPKFWRQGFGTEIARQLKEYAFANIEAARFISIIHKDNIGSIRVAENNDMKMLFESEFLGMAVYVFGINKH